MIALIVVLVDDRLGCLLEHVYRVGSIVIFTTLSREILQGARTPEANV
jgi:hypothetical protein